MATLSNKCKKQELRQKLESMKQAYAKTLRKVERSEKAKRTRSHVQRKIAEQMLHGASDASPSCTHSLRRTPEEISAPQIAGETDGVSAVDEGDVKASKEEASKSWVASKRLRRKRRSVSFIIPKEKATTWSSNDVVQGKTPDTYSGTPEDKALGDQQMPLMKPASLTVTYDPMSEVSQSADAQDVSTRTSNVEQDGFLRASGLEKCDEQRTSKLQKRSPLASPDGHMPQINKVGVKTAPSSAQSCCRVLRKDGLPSKSSSIIDDAQDRIRPTENVILVIPESQFTESLDASLREASCNHSTALTTHMAPGSSQVQMNATNTENEIGMNLQSGYEMSVGSPMNCTETFSSQPHTPSIPLPLKVATPHFGPSDEKDSSETTSKPPPNLHQSTTGVPSRRAGRKSRRRPRIPWELTMSDISLKEVVESQSTEEGSHTWIEGLMYPVEYYIRRTRSMTSSQCSQSQPDGGDARGSLEDDTRAGRRKQSVDTTCCVKDSSTQGMAAQASVSKVGTATARGVLESDSDTASSHLSESLLKTSPAQPGVEEYSDEDFEDTASLKLARTTKTRKRQGRQCISKTGPLSSKSQAVMSASLDPVLCFGEEKVNNDKLEKNVARSSELGASSDPEMEHEDTHSSQNLPEACLHKSATCAPGGIPLESRPELLPVNLHLSVGDVQLSQAEFALPDEDFGAMKRRKLQSNRAGDASYSKPERSGSGQECRSNGDAEHLPPDPHITEDLDTRTKTDDTCSVTLHQQICSASESALAPILKTAVNCPTPLPTSSSVSENLSNETKSCVDSAAAKPSRIGRELEIASEGQKDLEQCGLTAKGNDYGDKVSAGKLKGGSQVKGILHSQLSPTQGQGDRGGVPQPDCTPGWSPSCSPLDGNPRSLQRGKEKEAGVGVDGGSADKLQAAVTAHTCKSDALQSTCSSLVDDHVPSAPQSQRLEIPQSSSQEGCKRPTSAACSASLETSCEGQIVVSTSALEDPKDNGSTFNRPSQTIPSTECNVTPPAVHGGVPIDGRGNIHQISPFAGVATGTPPERAKEPQGMSQCEVTSENDDELAAEDESWQSKKELSLIGCLQHDVPWETSPTVLDVTGGKATVNGVDVDILLVLYRHTLVTWCHATDAMDFCLLQSWVLTENEEFIGALVLPCSINNTVSLVVTGIFSSCAIRMLTYNTATSATHQMDLNLFDSRTVAVPYILCVASEHEFAVAIQDDENKSAVFLVNVCIESSNVQTVRLSTGAEVYVTSLLQVEGTDRLLLATTSCNSMLIWNCETGDLMKDVLMKLTSYTSSISCLKAKVELGLLYLVVVLQNDTVEDKPIGVTLVLNPLTDKMATLVEYRTPHEYAQSSLVNSVLHNQSLLVRLSDGSLHQWDLFSGDLVNYSSLPPTNHSLRSAKFSTSQVVLLGSGQCQQVYDAY